jgi:beta-phosphoglucomutase-like phosphatase (HAD superfamily)
MLRAVIFDFDGVLTDSESLHLEMFQRVLRDEGIDLDRNEYYSHYLAMDDRDCFRAVYERNGRALEDIQLGRLIERKTRYFHQCIEIQVKVFPGVTKLVPELFRRFPLAIGSGALKSEIETILAKIGLRQYFQVIVSADDVSHGKPDPEIFIQALSLLNRMETLQPIQPSECLVIEDSKGGIRGAHAAGIKCLAVTNSYPADELSQADAVVRGLDEIDISFLEKLLLSPG